MLLKQIQFYNFHMLNHIYKHFGERGEAVRGFLVLLFLISISTGNGFCQSKKERSRSASKGKSEISSQSAIEQARSLLLSGKTIEALMVYSPLVTADSTNVGLSSEYAYALAVNGNFEAALYRIDVIWKARHLYPEVSFYASQIFSLMGNEAVAEALNEGFPGRKDPVWISKVAPVMLEKYKSQKPLDVMRADEVPEYFSRANKLTSRGFYLLAISLFSNITASFPDVYLPFVGYSIALEKAELYKSAAEALEKATKLMAKDPAKNEERGILEKRLSSLSTKSSQPANVTIAKVLAGTSVKKDALRLMAYAGGMISPSYTNVNGRFGYFLSGSGNAAVDLGISSMSGNTSYNLGMTYYQRRKVFVAGFGLVGSFTENTSAAFFKISVGFSFQSKNKASSWDIFWDGMAPFSRDQITTLGFSAGRSMYFGKRK